MDNLKDILPQLRAIAIEAGEVTLPYFKQVGLMVNRKGDNSPFTAADQAAEAIILKGLKTLTPTIPIIAEEQAEAGLSPDIAGHRAFWLVDPLDGTKDFIKGIGDFSVNIGLIVDGVPVLGVVYLPTEGVLYYGGKDLGAYKAKGTIETPILVNEFNPAAEMTVVAGWGDLANDDIRTYLNDLPVKETVFRGSSIKFCMIAEGVADFYPRLHPTYEWDTAAAHAILIAAGGDIFDMATRERLAYGKTDRHYLNGPLLTGGNGVLAMTKEKPLKLSL